MRTFRNLLPLLFIFLISQSYAQTILPIKKDGKWGAVNEKGEMIIEPQYEFVGNFDKVYQEGKPVQLWAYFRDKGKTGIIDQHGDILVAAEFDQAQVFPTGEVAVWKGAKVGLTNAAGGMIIEHEYDYIEPFGNVFKVRFKNKFGISNLEGKVVHTAIFDKIGKLKPNSALTTVEQNGKFGVIGLNGDLLLPAEYDKVELEMLSATAYKLKAIDVIKVDADGKFASRQTFNNQTDFNLTKAKNLRAETSKLLGEKPEMNKPRWEKEVLSYKLVNPYGQKILREEFYMVSQDEDLGLSMALHNNEKLDTTEVFLVEDSKAKVLFRKVAKDLVLTDFAESDLARISIDTLWDGLISKAGELKTEIGGQKITNIGNFSEGLASVQFGNRYGFINTKGEMAIPAEFDIVSEFKGGYAVGRKNGKFGVMDKAGKAVVAFEQDGVAHPSNGVVRIKQGRGRAGKWGLFDLNGKQILPFEYNIIGEFKNGEAIMRKNGKWGLIGVKGNVIIPAIISADWMDSFNGGSVAQIGKELIVENIAGVPKRRYKYIGYVNRKGEFIIEPKYSYIIHFDSVAKAGAGLAQIVKDDFVGFLNSKGEEVVAPKYAGIQGFEKAYMAGKGLAKIVNADGKFGYIDHRGNQVLNPAFSSVENFEAVLADTMVWARASDNGKYGFINHRGETKISFVYDNISQFENGTAIVRKGDKFGLINRKNELVLPLEYDGIRYLDKSDKKLLMVRKVNPTFYYFDKDGKVAKTEPATDSKPKNEGKKNSKYKYLSDFDENGYAVIADEKLKGIADSQGNVVVKPKYREIGLFSEGLAYFQADGKDRSKRKWGYLDKNGKVVIEPIFSKAVSFSDGMAGVLKGRWGFVDKSGKLVIPHKYRTALPFSNGKTVVDDNTIIDKTGKQLGVYGMSGKVIGGFQSDRAIAESNTGQFHIKADGMPAYFTKYDEVSSFNGNIAFVKRGEKWMLTRSINGMKTEVPFSRADKNAYIAKNGKLAKRKTPFGTLKDVKWTLVENGVWKAIDLNGNILGETTYDEVLETSSENLSKVRKNEQYGIANSAGEFIAEPKFEFILAPDKNIYRLEYQGKIGYLKSNGEWIWKVE